MLEHLEALFQKKVENTINWHSLSRAYPSSSLLYLMYIRNKYFVNFVDKNSLFEENEKNEDMALLYLFFYDSPLWIEYLLKHPNLKYIWDKTNQPIMKLLPESFENSVEENIENNQPITVAEQDFSGESINENIETEIELIDKELEETETLVAMENLEKGNIEDATTEIFQVDDIFTNSANEDNDIAINTELSIDFKDENENKENTLVEFSNEHELQNNSSIIDDEVEIQPELETELLDNAELNNPKISEPKIELTSDLLPTNQNQEPKQPLEIKPLTMSKSNPILSFSKKKSELTKSNDKKSASKSLRANKTKDNKLENIDSIPKIKRSIKQLNKELLSKVLEKPSKNKNTIKVEKQSLVKSQPSTTTKSKLNKPLPITPQKPVRPATPTKEFHSFESWLTRKDIKPVKGSLGVFPNTETEVYTETMAKLYEKQGDFVNALIVYEELSKQNTNKNFANKISALKLKIKNQE